MTQYNQYSTTQIETHIELSTIKKIKTKYYATFEKEMTENKCNWTIKLESACYHFCIESTKKNTPVYEPQHQTTEHYCIQTALTHYTILVHATIDIASIET